MQMTGSATKNANGPAAHKSDMLVNIQFLRFAAAMLVVLYHTAARTPPNQAALKGLLDTGQSLGFAGVDIFFVISGFIMAHTTAGHAGGRHSLDFARRRLARIFSGYWPFYFAALGIFALYRPAHFAESHLLASFFLWPQSLNLVLLEISWTLSYELYFYLLFSLLIFASRPRQRFSIVAAVTLLLLAFNLYRHFVSHAFDAEHIYFQPFWLLFLSSPFLLEFFAGSLIAWWLRQHGTGPAWLWFSGGCLLFLAGGWINEHVYGGLIEQGYHTLPRVLVFGLPAAMIVAGLVRLERHGRQAPVAFSLLTGGASYAIYLSHIPILTWVWNGGLAGLINGWPDNLMVSAYLLVMGFILLYSVAHYRWLERPLHRVFKRLLGVSARHA